MKLERTVFKMYVKDGCPYCDKARDIILNEEKASLHVINVTKNLHLRETIIEDTGQKTLPAIFIGKEFIGGCDDLSALQESDKLEVLTLREENQIFKEEIMRLRRSL
tara:strand:- start:2424 stop:2744 length:321 start_codon:yes stop_codon:yes gene_type:complete